MTNSDFDSRKARVLSAPALAAMTAFSFFAVPAPANSESYLKSLHTQTQIASTVPDNGDVNPYAVVVAPVAAGKIQQGDVLISNFNNSKNLQGLGTTIVSYRPATHATTLFASAPHQLDSCPGGVGLTTAMTMLKSGYVIVGSLPSNDGTMSTSGAGCLLVFDANGTFVKTLVSAKIDGPWGNMAVIDNGASATLFVSNISAGRQSGGKEGKVANVVRIDLETSGGAPVVKSETVVASGFSQAPDKDVFVIGPTGLALDQTGTLYVSDAIANSIVAIPDAMTRKTSAGTGNEITKDGLLKRPLAMAIAPNGNLLVLNGQNGQVVEIDPASHEQLGARWINANKAQTPPGSGNLFGFAMTLDGTGFYYVNDDVNYLALAH